MLVCVLLRTLELHCFDLYKMSFCNTCLAPTQLPTPSFSSRLRLTAQTAFPNRSAV